MSDSATIVSRLSKRFFKSTNVTTPFIEVLQEKQLHLYKWFQRSNKSLWIWLNLRKNDMKLFVQKRILTVESNRVMVNKV